MKEMDNHNPDYLLEHMGENAAEEPASEFYIGKNGVHSDNVTIVNQSNEVKLPMSYKKDSYIYHRANDLRKARRFLLDIYDEKNPIKAEVCLGLSTTLIGAFLGSLSSGLNPLSFLGVFFIWVFPVVGVAFLVAYCFIRRQEKNDHYIAVERALEYLVDPDEGEVKTNECE